ncbi:SET domain-containing protein 4 [Podochytrium sp. JEL0797]|nr:SET domain-containing protein 4 [Podochytrium sp. JEL0797]
MDPVRDEDDAAWPRDGFWNAYLDVIPKSFDTVAANLPEALLRLLPDSVQSMATIQVETFEKDYAAVMNLISDSTIRVTKEDYRWGWYAVNTRCITLNTAIPTSSTLKFKQKINPRDPKIALAPFLDLLNHSVTAKISATLNPSKTAFEIMALQEVREGDECFISYGAHDNAFLLVEYGFVVSEGNGLMHNPFDHVVLDREVMGLVIPGETKGFRERVMGELEGFGLFGDYTLQADSESYRVMNALRLYACGSDSSRDFETLLVRWRRVVNGQIEEVSKENERVARGLLHGICRVLVDDLTGRLEKVDEWKGNASQGGNGALQAQFVRTILEMRHSYIVPADSALWRQCAVLPFLSALQATGCRTAFSPPLPVGKNIALGHNGPFSPPDIGTLKIIQGENPHLPPALFAAASRDQLDRTGRNESDNLCQPGQLIDKGKESMMAFGNSLREQYSHFLPQVLTKHFKDNNLYVRSTGYIRTVVRGISLIISLVETRFRRNPYNICSQACFLSIRVN